MSVCLPRLNKSKLFSLQTAPTFAINGALAAFASTDQNSKATSACKVALNFVLRGPPPVDKALAPRSEIGHQHELGHGCLSTPSRIAHGFRKSCNELGAGGRSILNLHFRCLQTNTPDWQGVATRPLPVFGMSCPIRPDKQMPAFFTASHHLRLYEKRGGGREGERDGGRRQWWSHSRCWRPIRRQSVTVTDRALDLCVSRPQMESVIYLKVTCAKWTRRLKDPGGEKRNRLCSPLSGEFGKAALCRLAWF